jgi:hypothetical protein
MSNQHRATPEDWEYIRLRAEDGVGLLNCILELRARIEATEAAQQIRVFSAEEVAPIVVPTTKARPAGLVERVAVLITSAATSRGAAENVLREVAAAALQMAPDKNLTWERVALWLEREADRG